MFLIVKLILTVLINKTYGYIIQNREIILLPAWNPAGAEEMSLTFKVFGKLVQLNMHRNDKIVLSDFKEWKNKTKGVTEKSSELKTSNSCFHLYEDYFRSAAFNICQEHGLEGFVFLENDTLEIRPLQNSKVDRSLFFIDDFCVKAQINLSTGIPHLVKQSQDFVNLDFHQLHKITSKRSYNETLIKQKGFTIELAVFVNAKAYNWLLKLKQFGIDHITVMMQYVNRKQNIFYHPSLGVKIDILLVRLDFMKEQPPGLPVYIYDVMENLNSFCKYAHNLNPLSDDDPRHWDISLYIVGEDIYPIPLKYEYWQFPTPIYRNSFFNTACNLPSSCALVILSLNRFRDFYLTIFDSLAYSEILSLTKSADVSSVAAVHEIGHLLGLPYDDEEKICTAYVMCQGEKSYEKMKWSPRSHNMIKARLEQKLCLLDHTNTQNIDGDHYGAINAFEESMCENYPGRKQTAKAQCESFLHDDEDANVVTLYDICKNLQCKTPQRDRVYLAGRALNGTHCALEKECCNGQCVPIIEPPYNFKYCEKDNWSEWKEDSCKSNCLVKSKRTLIKRRFCHHRGLRTAKCTGLYYNVELCDDSCLCNDKRMTIAEFTLRSCIKYIKFAEEAYMTVELLAAPGHQMLHDVEKPWIACTILYRQQEKPNWYALRQEFPDYGLYRYFPDGTWCHNDDVQDYYCLHHYCLPENYSFVNSEECKNNC